MNISKKIIAVTAVCAALGAGITAYASQPSAEIAEDPSAESTVSVEEAALTEEETASINEIPSAEDEAVTADEESAPAEEETVLMNEPSEGDEIMNEKYFIHKYSNGDRVLTPFDPTHGIDGVYSINENRELQKVPNPPIDVEAIKKLGSDTPFKDELCYEVIEFLDGTKRYFKLTEERDFLYNCSPQCYGIHSYIEGGTGVPYYEEVDGGFIQGWR